MNDFQWDSMIKYKDRLDSSDKFAIDKMLELKEKDDKVCRTMDFAVAESEIYRRNSKKFPFRFNFDPEKSMPEVFENKFALMVWSGWRTKHLYGSHQDLNKSSLEIVEFMKTLANPTSTTHKGGKEISRRYNNLKFDDEQKKKIVSKFCWMMEMGYHEEGELEYWNEEIFPLLSKEREFEYEVEVKPQ